MDRYNILPSSDYVVYARETLRNLHGEFFFFARLNERGGNWVDFNGGDGESTTTIRPKRENNSVRCDLSIHTLDQSLSNVPAPGTTGR